MAASELFATPLLQPFDSELELVEDDPTSPFAGINEQQEERLPDFPAGLKQSLASAVTGISMHSIEDEIVEPSDIQSVVPPVVEWDSDIRLPTEANPDQGFQEAPSKTTARAAIIAFTGGGAAIEHSLAVARSAGIALSLDATWGQGGAYVYALAVEIQSFGFGTDLEDAGEYGIGNAAEGADEEGVETSVGFALADSAPFDMFDGEILRDPVYGTPVFRTRGGRSCCPHEVCYELSPPCSFAHAQTVHTLLHVRMRAPTARGGEVLHATLAPLPFGPLPGRHGPS